MPAKNPMVSRLDDCCKELQECCDKCRSNGLAIQASECEDLLRQCESVRTSAQSGTQQAVDWFSLFMTLATVLKKVLDSLNTQSQQSGTQQSSSPKS